MTDYLEEIGGEDAEALLEAERRLAVAVIGRRKNAAGIEREGPEEPDVPRSQRYGREAAHFPAWKTGAGERTIQTWESLAGARGSKGDFSTAGKAKETAVWEMGLEEDEADPPLMDEVYALDQIRAGVIWLERQTEGRGSGWSGGVGGALGRNDGLFQREGSWDGISVLRRPSSGSSEDMVQAELLDRAFRRDSRRYDGGFFLY